MNDDEHRPAGLRAWDAPLFRPARVVTRWLIVLLVACEGPAEPHDASVGSDAAAVDGGAGDSGMFDGGSGMDAALADAGSDAGFDGGFPDAGFDGGFDAGDAGPRDAGPPAPPVGFGPMLTSLSPADYACRGTVAAPPSTGPLASFNGIVTDFQNDMPVGGLVVHHFADDVPTAGCTGSCVSRTSATSGLVALSAVPGSWSAARLLAGDGVQSGSPRAYLEVLHYHLVGPLPGGSLGVDAMQAATRNTILTLLGVMREPSGATIFGTLTDCGGNAIANATVRVFGASGEVALAASGRTGPRGFYFGDTGLPAASRRSTNINGLFGAGNLVVPSDRRVRVELWGSLADGPSELLGCEAVEAIADGVTIVPIGPRRADGPSDCTP